MTYDTILKSRFVKTIGAAALLAIASSGCDAPATTGVEHQAYPLGASAPGELDILFMVDNSGSMLEEQLKLRKNFTALIDTLRALPGGLPDLHIGVISSDVGAGNLFISGNPACNRPGGDKGEFQVKAGCGLNGATSRFLVSSNNNTQKNFTGNLEDVFACMANLGTKGCGFEHQLQSVRVALHHTTVTNAGFLRPNAVLMIVMVTDEDDCSGSPTADVFADPGFVEQTGSLRCNIVSHICNGIPVPTAEFTTPLSNCRAAPNGGGRLIPVDEFTRFVRELKPNHPERIVVSAITGMPNPGEVGSYSFSRTTRPGSTMELDVAPVCSSGADGTAAPSLRIAEFVNSFGANGLMQSICTSDFAPAFQRLGDLVSARLNGSVPDGGATADASGTGAPTADAGAGTGGGTGTGKGGTPPAGTASGGASGGAGAGGAVVPSESADDSSSADNSSGCNVGAKRTAGLAGWANALLVGSAIGWARKRRRNR